MENEKVAIIHRLSPEQLREVWKRAGLALSVNSNTTPLEAGVQLGMARVLDILREGFTIEHSNPE